MLRSKSSRSRDDFIVAADFQRSMVVAVESNVLSVARQATDGTYETAEPWLPLGLCIPKDFGRSGEI
jgi:hypothetical protein